MPAELFQCNRCGRLYDRGDFTKGVTTCESCGCKRFQKAGRFSFFQEVAFIFRHPRLTWAELRGS